MALYGPQNLPFIEWLNVLCPLFGVSFKRGSTIYAKHSYEAVNNNNVLIIKLLLQLPYQIQPIPLVALYCVEHSTTSTWRHRYILYAADIASNYAFALVSPSSHVYVSLTMTAIQCLVLPNGLMPVKQQLQLYWGYQPTSKW